MVAKLTHSMYGIKSILHQILISFPFMAMSIRTKSNKSISTIAKPNACKLKNKILQNAFKMSCTINSFLTKTLLGCSEIFIK